MLKYAGHPTVMIRWTSSVSCCSQPTEVRVDTTASMYRYIVVQFPGVSAYNREVEVIIYGTCQ